jgi:hypothetical protein
MATMADVPLGAPSTDATSQLPLPPPPPLGNAGPHPVPNAAGPSSAAGSPAVGYDNPSNWAALEAQKKLDTVLTPAQIAALKSAGLYPAPEFDPSKVSAGTMTHHPFGYKAALSMPYVPRDTANLLSINATANPSFTSALPLGTSVLNLSAPSSSTHTNLGASSTSTQTLMQPSFPPGAPSVQSITVVQTKDPPIFTGQLDEKRIPDLNIWYRRVECHSLTTHQHIRDVLDRCTEGVANQIVQQFYLQNITDPVIIKSMFLNHFSHLVHRDSLHAFNKLMFGEGIKMKTDDSVEGYISHFRLCLFKADIPEQELKPKTAIVRTLVQVFLKGLPEPIAKDLRVNKEGDEYSNMQELYDAALISGRKFLKRKAASQTSPSSDNSNKKQKTPSKSAPDKQKSPSPKPDKKPPSTQGRSRLSKPSAPSNPSAGNRAATASGNKQLYQKALSTLSQVKGQPGVITPPLYENTPVWPEPFPEFNHPSLPADKNAYYVAKSVVGTDRMNAARANKACVFCTLPLPADRPPAEHLQSCKHRPY